MESFIGSFEHNLDAKNRLFVPAKFREGLSGHFLIKAVVSEYPCIEAFRKDDYDAATEEALAAIADPTIRRMRRFAAYAGTSDAVVDAQGRIPIPAKIAKIAGLTKETLVVGMGDHVEIWNPATFDAYFAEGMTFPGLGSGSCICFAIPVYPELGEGGFTLAFNIPVEYSDGVDFGPDGSPREGAAVKKITVSASVPVRNPSYLNAFPFFPGASNGTNMIIMD